VSGDVLMRHMRSKHPEELKLHRRDLLEKKAQTINKPLALMHESGHFDRLVVNRGVTETKTYGGRPFNDVQCKQPEQPEALEAEFCAAEFCAVQVKEEFDSGSVQLKEEMEETEMEVGGIQLDAEAPENGHSQIEIEFDKEFENSVSSEALVRHERTKEEHRQLGLMEKKEQHRCDPCERNFATRQSLRGHKAKCMPLNYKCDICQLKLKSERTLEAHRDGIHQYSTIFLSFFYLFSIFFLNCF
jgi:hypothetical protein